MSLRLCLFFFCLFGVLSAGGQVSYSLGEEAAYASRMEREAAGIADDSAKANAYFKLSLLCRRMNDTARSKRYLQEGMVLGNPYPMLKAAAVYYKTMAEYVPGDIGTLERNLMKSDSALRSFTDTEAYKLRGILWNNYAILQQMKGDDAGALDAFTNKAAGHARQSGDFMVLGKTYKGISIIFMNANQRDKAAGYLRQALASIRKSPLDNPLNLTELIETYIVAGENYVHLEQYDSARTMIDTARKMLVPYPSSNLYMIFYFSEGFYFDKTRRYEQAVRSFDAGIARSAAKSGSPYSLNRLRYAKYKSLKNQEHYKSAVAELKALVASPYVFTVDKKLYYQELYATYSKLGDTKEALGWAERYIVLSDSLYAQKFQKDIIELESKYKHAEDARKIAALQLEKDRSVMTSRNNRLLNWLLGIISLFLFATAVFAVILYRQRVSRYRQRLLDAEREQQIELARALMQGEEQERKRLAIDLHDGLGGQLAGIKINLSRMATNASPSGTDLHRVIDQLDASSNELRRIARNMMPESLLLLGLEPALKDMCDSMSTDATRVVFQSFGIDPALHKEMQMNVYRIVQELLANAIRHAAATEVLVQCSQNESRFFITIEDNGKGFSRSEATRKPGIGLSNVQSRVEYLKGKVDISSAAGEGTTINIEFDVTIR